METRRVEMDAVPTASPLTLDTLAEEEQSTAKTSAGTALPGTLPLPTRETES